MARRYALDGPGSNAGAGKICPTYEYTDRRRGPFSLLYNEHRVSLAVVKRPGRGADHPPSYGTGIEYKLNLYRPSASAGNVMGQIFTSEFYKLAGILSSNMK